MKRIEDMTLREKIGQLMMCGFPGTDATEMIDLIKRYKIGNVILFARNVKDPKQLFELNQTLQKVALETLGQPLFISIDQEGGMVTRIFHGATFFPGQMTIGATDKPEYAYRIGQMMGKELYHLGINFNLAPVLDVNNNPYNPVIGVRSYGDSPEKVARFGVQFIKGLQENRVLATAKHFPGHGDTSVDSHLDLPAVNHDLQRLETIELYPFKQAIDHGVAAIMTAHVLFPAYEPDRLPATLSKRVLTGLLREKLHFKGLIVTDCLEMKAIDKYFTTERAAVMALNAGVNLLTISHTKTRQIGVLEAVEQAVQAGELDEKVIDGLLARVLEYKAKILPDVEAFLHQTYEEAQSVVNHPDHRTFAQKVADEALTQVKGTQFATPKQRTLFLAPRPQALTIADDEVGTKGLLEEVERHFPHWTVQSISLTPSPDEIQNILSQAKAYEQVVLGTYNANIFKEQRQLMERLKETAKTLYVIALRNPYDLMEIEINGLAVYEYTHLTIHTIVRYLKGELKPNGVLPVHIP